MARITVSELREAFAALQHAEEHAGIRRTLHLTQREMDEIGTEAPLLSMGPQDMILQEGSATYGNAWGIFYSPWHNPASPAYRRALSGHYETGIGRLSTDRREALVRMRSYTAGIYAAMRAQNEVSA